MHQQTTTQQCHCRTMIEQLMPGDMLAVPMWFQEGDREFHVGNENVPEDATKVTAYIGVLRIVKDVVLVTGMEWNAEAIKPKGDDWVLWDYNRKCVSSSAYFASVEWCAEGVEVVSAALMHVVAQFDMQPLFTEELMQASTLYMDFTQKVVH